MRPAGDLAFDLGEAITSPVDRVASRACTCRSRRLPSALEGPPLHALFRVAAALSQEA